MVHYSLFMVLCLNFMLFCVSRRSRALDARAHVFVRFCTVQYGLNKISRFYALTSKITYLGRFSTCMVRHSCKVVITWCQSPFAITNRYCDVGDFMFYGPGIGSFVPHSGPYFLLIPLCYVGV